MRPDPLSSERSFKGAISVVDTSATPSPFRRGSAAENLATAIDQAVASIAGRLGTASAG